MLVSLIKNKYLKFYLSLKTSELRYAAQIRTK